MKKITIIILAATILLASCQTFKQEPLAMGEQEIAFSNTVGIFNNAGNKAPAVLLLHGFASNKDEVAGLYVRLSEELFKAGISTLRIDFRGWGDSSFPMELSSIDNMILDAEEALQWLKSRKDVGDVAIHGFSLGAGVAINVAANNNKNIKAMGLWSAVSTFESEQEEMESISMDAVNKAMTEGKAEFDLGWRSVTLGKDFFDSLSKYDLLKDYENYKGNVLMIAGAEDELVVSLKILGSLAADRTETVAIANAGHIFAVFSDNPEPANQLLEKTVTWYTENLK